MDNAIRYQFADFTLENFRNLVRLAKQNYRFRWFHNFDRSEKFILWRHDVDISVHRAVKLARVEAEEGVHATYFLHLHSEFYNLLELEIKSLVKELTSLGHALGLHFDTHFFKTEQKNCLERRLTQEKRILEEYFESQIDVFSFHNASSEAEQFVQTHYAGMINACADYFRKEVAYCSDSNGYWRHRRLEDVLREATDPRLQVLTHPELWHDIIMSPRERVERCIRGRAEKTRDRYRAILRGAGREDVDW